MNDQRRRYNQRLLIAIHIAILPLLTSFGMANAGLLQLYATNILDLDEDKIGLLIGLPALVIPLQLLGLYLIGRLGNKRTVMLGFLLLFCLLPLMLIIPGVYRQDTTLGFALLCATVMAMHLAHNATKGVALQPMFRESTLPGERGRFLSKISLTANGFNLLFFATLSVMFGARIDMGEYAWITFFLMGYCAFAFVTIHRFQNIRDDGGDNLPHLFRRHFMQGLREALMSGNYRLSLMVMALTILSSLPLFVTYLSTGPQLDASHISQLMSINVAGTMAGLLVWGRLIDRMGFMGVLSVILSLFVASGGLWLFAQPVIPPHGISLSLVVLGLIAGLTGFLRSGLRLALLVGVHNGVTQHTAVVALAVFNTSSLILGSLASIAVGYYLDFTLGSRIIDFGRFYLDSYQLLGLTGALLCAVAGMLCRR
uniref:Major Facilitator Superfamily protein n=1 Tax=Candidatus Kentrum sp. TUN TaxID=2126343 RepID=A0A451AXJ3_9GAMM|nr:MAG: Major Facilitator Superfamily protein [Candidatus Kentron sp. TUN]VFK70765.1 MAG: Major Facilitator Superfamily protein [Candidatus Kentron sp. TUN]